MKSLLGNEIERSEGNTMQKITVHEIDRKRNKKKSDKNEKAEKEGETEKKKGREINRERDGTGLWIHRKFTM